MGELCACTCGCKLLLENAVTCQYLDHPTSPREQEIELIKIKMARLKAQQEFDAIFRNYIMKG